MPDPIMTVAVSKIETVAADENQEVSQANQDMIEVEDMGNNKFGILVDGELNSYASTNPAQGVGKWIGLAVNTGESDITKVKYNGKAFTVADVAEATSVGVPAGSFVWWVKEEKLPQTMKLATEGKSETVITIEKLL